jgi:hypothetical protein
MCLQIFSMGRNYKRTTTRGSYGEEKLKQALQQLTEGMSYHSVAKKFGIPRRTLQRHMKGQVRNPGKKCLGRFETVHVKNWNWVTLMIHHATCAPSGIMNHLLSHGSSVPHAKSGTTRVVVPRTLQFVITASKLSAYLHFYFSSRFWYQIKTAIRPYVWQHLSLSLLFIFAWIPKTHPGSASWEDVCPRRTLIKNNDFFEIHKIYLLK